MTADRENAREGALITALMDRLFVYGTLRRGSANEQAQMLAKSARLIGSAKIRGRLFRVTHYPGLVAPASEIDWVRGDLFEGVTAETIERLDEYEGPEYVRQLAEVTAEDGRIIAAFLYLYTANAAGLELITSGDWLAANSPSSPLE